jgi:predicted DNA-binding protein with PD1-like motif
MQKPTILEDFIFHGFPCATLIPALYFSLLHSLAPSLQRQSGGDRSIDSEDNQMAISGSLSMTRRCFFAEAGLAVAVPVGWQALADGRTDLKSVPQVPSQTGGGCEIGLLSPIPHNLPEDALLSDGNAKTYLLVFHTGQEVMDGLLAFARKHDLVAGHLTGIGAISHAVIGYFDPRKKAYLRTQEKEQAEVLSLTGNLALYNKEPFFHVHVALGLRDGSARGGHLFAATVRPTVELALTASPRPVQRKIDPETGLPLLAPPH